MERLAGNVSWTTYGLDLRRYDPLVFSYLTLASRVAVNISAGPDEMEFPKFIGRPDFVRGYDRELYTSDCSTSATDPSATRSRYCATTPGDWPSCRASSLRT